MKFITTIMLALIFMGSANADLDTSLDQMCDKIKNCSIQNMGTDVPPGMEEMMKGLFDGMCKSMLAPYYSSVGEAGLEDKAEACIETVLDVSCETLTASEGEQYSSPECDDFKEAADEAGIDVDQ